jgi:hypothetical protein
MFIGTSLQVEGLQLETGLVSAIACRAGTTQNSKTVSIFTVSSWHHVSCISVFSVGDCVFKRPD